MKMIRVNPACRARACCPHQQPLPDPSTGQPERMLVIFDMLISL